MNSYKIIDEKSWARAVHCAVFRNCIEPAFCVTFDVDVTNFRRQVKARNLSFTLSMVYAVCKCANDVEAFRYRFLDGRVVLFEKIDTAFTWIDAGEELFKVVNVPLCDSLESYVELAKRTAENQREYFAAPLGNDVFQCSPLPWLTYTHISHTNSGRKDNATPQGQVSRNGRQAFNAAVRAGSSFVRRRAARWKIRRPAAELFKRR